MKKLTAFILCGIVASLPYRSWAQRDSTPPVTQFNLIDWLGRTGFSLSRTQVGKGRSDGALFSATQQRSQNFQFSTEFAVTWVHVLERFRNFSELSVEASIDAQLQGPSNRRGNFINVRPQLSYIYTSPRHERYGRWSIYGRFGPIFEASSDFRIENALFEIELAPSSDALGMGAILPASPISPQNLRFTWQPVVNFQVGTNIRGRELSLETSRTRLRIAPIVSATLYFEQLANQLGIEMISLSAENRTTILPESRRRRVYNFFRASLDFAIRPAIGFSVSYENGARAPEFTDHGTFKIALTFGFGRVSTIPSAY